MAQEKKVLSLRKKVFFTSIGVFLLISLVSVVFSFFDISYEGWKPATCWPTDCFCEAPREGTVSQPVNAYSNLSFVLVGMLIVGLSESRWVAYGRRFIQPTWSGRNLIRARRSYSIIYGIAIVIIGVGSLFYHASLSFAGEWFDLMGMYLLVTFFLLYSWARLFDWKSETFAFYYILVNCLLSLQQLYLASSSRVVFGSIMVGALILEVIYQIKCRPKMNSRYLIAAVGAFLLGWGVWLLDLHGVICEPNSWLQGHAAWHFLTATAAGLNYLYYRSETQSRTK